MTKKSELLDKIILVLSILGALISFYILYNDIAGSEVVCPDGGCVKVSNSEYSRFLGIPVAALGLFYYLALFGIRNLKKVRNNLYEKIVEVRIEKLLLVAGVIFSIYLRYIEIFKIKAVCIWCWGSVFVLFGIVIAYFYENKQSEQ